MTNEEIKQNAEEYAKKHYDIPFEDDSSMNVIVSEESYIAGAHSRDEEINHWKESYEELAEISDELQKERQTLMIENARLSNKWIKCSEQPPKKRDGKIRSDVVLVALGQCWTAAEYHFGDKRWINMLGEREAIEPEYWQEVNLPEDILEKGE